MYEEDIKSAQRRCDHFLPVLEDLFMSFTLQAAGMPAIFEYNACASLSLSSKQEGEITEQVEKDEFLSQAARLCECLRAYVVEGPHEYRHLAARECESERVNFLSLWISFG